MTTGLPVQRLIDVSVTLTPSGAQYANINTLMIIGDTNVISPTERYRSYGSIEEVGVDFGETDPEYLAAEIFFSQDPQPTQLYIARWNRPTETALAAVQALDALPVFAFGYMFAAGTMPDNTALTAVAAYIEAAANPHLFGIRSNEASAINPAGTTDIGYLIKALGYKRTFCDYSTTQAYPQASVFGRIVTVNLDASDSMITLMYKRMPGVVAENLTTTQANALDAKRYNYYANFDNGVAILVNGMCSGDAFIDEIFATDALKIRIQTDVFNLLASVGKVPQTDGGNNQIYTTIEAALEAFVTNGFLAPGTWQSGGFGQLAQGEYLPKGYYIYAPPISTQSPTNRALRKSVVFQIAAKEAGAVHQCDIMVAVNR